MDELIYLLKILLNIETKVILSFWYIYIYFTFFIEQVNVEIVGQSSSSQTTEFSSVVDGSMWSSDGVEPVPETVTVTLTQKPGDGMYLKASSNRAFFISECHKIC